MWLLVLNLSVALAQIPASPMWPNTFWQNFTETTHYAIGDHVTTGSYYYDWTVQSYRIDRANGRYDRYCGILGPYQFDNTPCSQIVSSGNRYIYYADKKDCCFCCNSASGCGMLDDQRHLHRHGGAQRRADLQVEQTGAAEQLYIRNCGGSAC